jgi:site-specific recombinase XerC
MAEAQRLIDAIEPWTLARVRNRAIIGVMGYAWASLDAALGLRVRDYFVVGDRRWLRLIENGAERHELVDRRIEPLIDAYLAAAGIGSEPHTVLFRSIEPRQRVSARSVARREIVQLIRSSAKNQQYNPPSQSETHKLIQHINGSNTIALRDRAILGMIAYTDATIRDIIAMKVDDFYKSDDEYWVKLPDRLPVRAAPELATLMQDYRAGIRGRSRGMAFLFGRDRVHPLTASDVHKILRRYRIKGKI